MTIRYDDASSSTETFPSKGVELLLPCTGATKVYAATNSKGTTIAYDKNVNNVHTGDLVDCRLKLSGVFGRARVVQINRNEETCSVLFFNKKVAIFESSIPLEEGHINCVEKGAQNVEWLLGTSMEENGIIGKVLQVHSFENGHASRFEIQIQNESIIRTYEEVIHNLFSIVVARKKKFTEDRCLSLLHSNCFR